MSSEFCVVLTTVATRDEANKLARQLVEQQLAACVQMMPINSVYSWEGAIQQDDEVLLLIKTASARYAGVEAFLLAKPAGYVLELRTKAVAILIGGHYQRSKQEDRNNGEEPNKSVTGHNCTQAGRKVDRLSCA